MSASSLSRSLPCSPCIASCSAGVATFGSDAALLCVFVFVREWVKREDAKREGEGLLCEQRAEFVAEVRQLVVVLLHSTNKQ